MSRSTSCLVFSLLIMALTSACDQDVGTSAQRRGGEPTVDEVGLLLQQVKDGLADDRIGEALALMDRLLAIRKSQPPARQGEIDRLDAMFAAERAAGRR